MRSLPVCPFKIDYTDDFQDLLVESLNFAVNLGPVGYPFSVLDAKMF